VKIILDILETYNLTRVRRIPNNVSCVSMVLCTLTHGFFGNKQYTAITPIGWWWNCQSFYVWSVPPAQYA